MRYLITGAPGLIGKALIKALLKEKHEVIALVRSPENFHLLPKENIYRWSHEMVPPINYFDHIDVVVHLAGAGIADKRWSVSRKKILYDSRVLGTRNLVQGLKNLSLNKRPKVLISGSAIGVYGRNPTLNLTGQSSPGKGFIADLCQQWEAEALSAEELNLRVILSRTGVVFAKEGGALSKMPPVIIGNGQDWISWIHLQDLVRFIIWASENNEVDGVFNLVSPQPVQNRELVKALKKFKGFPISLYTPKFLPELIVGEMSEVLLASQKVEPKKLLGSGFQFQFSSLQEAFKNIYGS